MHAELLVFLFVYFFPLFRVISVVKIGIYLLFSPSGLLSLCFLRFLNWVFVSMLCVWGSRSFPSLEANFEWPLLVVFLIFPVLGFMLEGFQFIPVFFSPASLIHVFLGCFTGYGLEI